MNLNLIPVLRDDVQISRVKTPESKQIILYVSSKGRKITPNEASCELIMMCDGTHTLKEIVSYFAKVSGESPSSLKEQLERILKRLVKSEAIQFVEVPIVREMPSEVELVHPLERVIIEMTDACNLNCVHCYNDSGHNSQNELTREEMYQLIDEMKRLGVLKINLSGGEPLMHPDFFKIAEYIRDSSLGLELFTNGTLVTRDVAKKLKALHILKVSVSLDSVTPEIHDFFRGKKGAWKKTMEGIRNLKAEGIKIKSAVSLSQLNVKEVVPLREFFLKEGIDDYKFMPVSATGRKTPLDIGITPEEYENAQRTILVWEKSHNIEPDPLVEQEGSNCGIGSTSLVIKCNGDVVPCPSFGKTLTVGNVRDHSIEEVWNDSALLNTLRNLDATTHPACGSCDLSKYCRGGCIANACLKTGTPHLYDPFSCAFWRAQVYVQNIS